MKELATALAAAQAEFPPIERTKTVKVRTRTGADYSFNYAPLDSVLEKVRPALAKHGLSVSQLLTHVEKQAAIRTLLLHSSGEYLEDVFPIPAAPLIGAQELGAIVTYCRRYAIVAVLGIATEEDDEKSVARRRAKPPAEEPTAAQGENREPADKATGRKSEDSPAASSAGGQGASPFQPPTGPRGGQQAAIEAQEISAELLQLVKELGAEDSIPKIHEKVAEGDVTWLKRQRTTAAKALERRAAEA